MALLGSAATPAQKIEFNRDIRPIVSDKCFTCHGPDAAHRKTKLRFDIESGALIELPGGKHAIVPGDPDKSEMYLRISSTDKNRRMPPAYMGHERLTDREIQLIRDWIAQGAPWSPFWSFAPPKRPPLPTVQTPGWVKTPIDAFILNRLEREVLHPSPEADKATLIRRVSLDLTGLPPTPEQVASFLADHSASAYEKVVDRLLASPEYAEHMAYRWMEAARYGDTNGYQTDGPREMWRWRDWVIDAFRRNMPYDEFTTEQLAGDLLANPTLDQEIATGFNRNHRTSGEGGIIPEEYRVEYVADRAQTTANVWMGITMGCARCHDHKYDPIFQKDFYRLFAYFNRVPNEKGFAYNYGNEEPFLKAPLPEQKQKLSEFDTEIASLEKHYAALQPALHKAQAKWDHGLAGSKPLDWTVTKGLVFRSDAKIGSPDVATETGPAGPAWRFDGKHFLEIQRDIARFGYLDPFTFSAWIKPATGKGAILSQAEDYFEGTGHSVYLIDGKVRLHIVHRWTDLALRLETLSPIKLSEWQQVTVTYDGKRKAAGVHIYLNGEEQKTKVLFDQLNEPFHVDEKVPFRIGAAGGLRFEGSISDVRVYKAVLIAQEAAAISVRESVTDIAAIAPEQRSMPQSQKMALAFLDQAAPENIKQARAKLDSATEARTRYWDAVPTVMVMVDDPKARDTFLLKRGAYDAHGEKVEPGIPSILPQPRPEWPNNRLGLAKWIVDRGNPLTARVTVNRYWQSYFGFGIVKTVDDFGSQGEWPVHPELLDWLAVEFMDNGWNVKAMQKLIVMSATYQQSSKVTPEQLQKDPDNRLLARGPRYRLGPEEIRDQALAVSGLLVEKVGGPSVKPYQPPGLWQELAGGGGYVQDKGDALYRRSLYTYWKRTVTPPFMANFDAPNREVCTVYENRTNTPLQALDLMNDVAFLEASRKLAERMMVEGGATPAERLDHGFQLVLGRPPRQTEKRILLTVLASEEAKYENDAKSASELLSSGESPIRAGLDVREVASYATIASLILNMDATITKE
jgi:Protein of unknown function (DUF1553)/Protein of unknown function (DUF1549)/Concanavalin A-like lectin/glucanases superfamily/Planctomycete cytochrome C